MNVHFDYLLFEMLDVIHLTFRFFDSKENSPIYVQQHPEN